MVAWNRIQTPSSPSLWMLETVSMDVLLFIGKAGVPYSCFWNNKARL